MKRLTFTYLSGYLALGGLGLLVAPDLTLRLLLSNGEYGTVMPRVVGLFMLVLSGLVFQFLSRGDYRYYAYTVFARSFIVLVFIAMYAGTRDPLFVVLNVIVLIGLLPSIYALVTAREAAAVDH